jgi:DNA (cytosine-5)-methyltransferase 1
VIKFVDLFAGTGGIRLGFEQATAEIGVKTYCVKSVEIDKRACETYQNNFDENPYGDITQEQVFPNFDVLLAGFPCQSFSYAGKQLGFADTRGTLFFEVERLLEKYRPNLCLLENVRGLTTHDQGRTFKTIIEKLKHLGYSVSYRLLNASNFGVPQNRVRVYIIAALDGEIALDSLSDVGAADSHQYKNKTVDLFSSCEHQLVVEHILEKSPDIKYDCSEWFTNSLANVLHGNLNNLHGKRLIDSRNGESIHSWELGLKGECSTSEKNFMNELLKNRRRSEFGTHQDGKALTIEQIQTFYKDQNVHVVIESLIKKGYLKNEKKKFNLVCGNMSFEVFKFLDPKSISITLTASDAQRIGVFHEGRVRRVTPRECARIQGYPDTYRLHPEDRHAYKQLGNAVSVPVVKALFLDYFKNNKTALLI